MTLFALRGFLVEFPALHFPDGALALKFFLQNFQGLVNIVVVDDDLQVFAPKSIFTHPFGQKKKAVERLFWATLAGVIAKGARLVHSQFLKNCGILRPVAVSTACWHGPITKIMAIRKIARMGHPILRQIAQPVPDPTAPEIQALIADMIETMKDADGAGLAAPQVYESLRLVIFHAPGDRAENGDPTAQTAPLTVLVNPEIEILGNEMAEGWEGCLSVPGLRGLVPRYTHLRYSGVDQQGRVIEREARGFHARVVQHECDHLDGLLYPQRMTDMSQLLFESEARHWIESQDLKGSDE